MSGLRAVLTISVAVAFSFGNAVYAQDYARTGAYVGINGFAAFEKFDDTAGADVDDSWGLGARVGYRAHRNYAIELKVEWYDEFDIDVPGFDADIDGWSVAFQSKFLLPVADDRVQPFALIGAGVLHGDIDAPFGLSDDETDFLWRLGLGVDLYATEQIAFAVEGVYNFPTGDLDDFEFWTLGLGLQYRF